MPVGLLRPGVHADVFARDASGRQVLVSTSRPCAECGQPLTGPVVQRADKRIHLRCPSYVDAYHTE